MMNSPDPMIDNNDPRLTAYALGELAPADVAQIEAALKSSPELQTVVADIRRASETISNVFLSEPPLQLTPEQKSQLLIEAESASNFDVRSANGRSDNGQSDNVDSVKRTAANVTPAVAGEYYQPSLASSAPWFKIAIAAGLASVLIGGAYYFSQTERGSMAATDFTVLNSESPVAGEDVSDEKSETPQTQPPTSKQESAELKESADFAGNPFGKRPPIARKTNEPTNHPSVFDDADSAADKKFDAQSGTSRSRNTMAGSTKLQDRAEKFGNAKGAVAESRPSDSLMFKHKPESSPNTLALAQKSLDQSVLGTLNLTVVAQSPGGGFGGGGAGAKLNQSSPTKPSKFSPSLENFADKKPLEIDEAEPNSPATFALQISNQDAKQMVDLLASHADPLQQRKLSFDDLIGSQALPLAAKGSERDDHLPESDSEFRDDAMPADRPAMDKRMLKAASPESLRQVAAATLASKLRKFIDQPLLASQRTISSIAPSPSPATEGVAALPQYRANSPSASANLDQPAFAAKDQALMDGATTSQEQPKRQAKKSVHGLPHPDINNKSMEEQQRLLSEFDFDYSQVIQQLKMNLEIRNRSLQGLK